jgi:FMN phosphatase YigB (HAD superfamily)
VLPPDASTRYAAWLVDLDGTLYRQTPVKFAMAAELMLFGWGAIPILRSFRQAHEVLRGGEQTLALAQSPFQRQLEHTAGVLGKSPDEVESTVREWMFERPLKWLPRVKNRALLEAILAYRNRGGKTALVSDYPASRKLAALGATGHFELVVSNGEPGGPSKLKPDPEGFVSAARQLGVEVESCLVIGDRDDADGAAARAAGMGFHLIR